MEKASGEGDEATCTSYNHALGDHGRSLTGWNSPSLLQRVYSRNLCKVGASVINIKCLSFSFTFKLGFFSLLFFPAFTFIERD